MWSWPVLSAFGKPSGDLTPRVLGELVWEASRGVCGDERWKARTPGSFSAAAQVLEPGLVVWAGSEVTGRLDHLLDGHRVFLPYLMAGHLPAFSWDASPAVTLMALPLLRSPFSGRVSVAVRVLDPWREFGVWVEPRHLAHRDCGMCAPTWAARLAEFEAAQADLDAAVAAGGEEYVPILFARADLYPAHSADDSGGSRAGWERPRVIVHASDVPAGPEGRGVGDGNPTEPGL